MSTSLNSPTLEDSILLGGQGPRPGTASTSHHMSDSSSYFPPASPQLHPSSPHTSRRGAMSSRFPRTTSSTSISGQNRRPQAHRSASVASSSFNSRGGHLYDREGGMFSEAEEETERNDSPSEDEDPGATPRRGRPMSIGRQSAHDAVAAGEDTTPEGGPIDREFNEDDPLTVKDRQSLINVQHPFGLPIWKPALYQKSRTVTRNAETELHAQPTRVIDSHYLPGNIIWTLVFGWWMALIFLIPAIVLFLVPRGGRQYSRLSYGLAWYIFWPFGKYVQGDGSLDDEKEDGDDRSVAADLESGARRESGAISSGASETSTGTIRGPSQPVSAGLGPSPSWDPVIEPTISLLRNPDAAGLKSYGSVPADLGPAFDAVADAKRHWLGRACFWLFLLCCILPVMLIVCLICWALVLTIPMAKLQWELINHLFWRHDKIQFCSAPQEIIVPSTSELATSGDQLLGEGHSNGVPAPSSFTVKAAPRLQPGQTAPTGSPKSKVLLCTYRAAGLQYYKYTVYGVNIMFINLLPVVFLVILDGFFLMPYVEKREHHGLPVHPVLQLLASQALIFVMSLASVIPLSYFIGMAVASISAQSSIGMGAVINATFGSIIEIILYGIALTQGKGLLVEGSIVGSLLAGVGLMPGVSMISGAMRQKEQKFNAKSAGVTSTMLIMAIIGTLTPTLFYQTYGNFELVCNGCPKSRHSPEETWRCRRCVYRHPDPVTDQFYQDTVKPLMYFCAAILLFSYLIGMWFSLRTHATQIWQNPQQLMNPLEAGSHITGGGATAAGGRLSMYNRIAAQQTKKLLRKASILTTATDIGTSQDRQSYRAGSGDGVPPYLGPPASGSNTAPQTGPPSPILRKVSYLSPGPSQAPYRPPGSASTSAGVGPILDTVSSAAKDPNHPSLPLPSNLTTDDFTRAVAVTVSALRQHEGPTAVTQGGHDGTEHGGGGHGGHEAPSWSRLTSATVLLSCTVLYAAIAEILVDVVDVVLKGSGIDEKFLGITLFALVPNTTEFMNAISFAMNGNIALSMEIGSAYALQVCLLQIPAMVAFSAWYDPRDIGQIASTFTMVFPKWDVIAIIFSIFLLTYTYIEAKSNYHRGSTLVLSYLVLTSGFYFAPSRLENEPGFKATAVQPALSFFQSVQTAFLSLFTH